MLDTTGISAKMDENLVEALRAGEEPYVLIIIKGINGEKAIQSEILSILSNNDLKSTSIGVFGDKLYGYITISGFDKLKNHPYVSEIIIGQLGSEAGGV